jgi:hypothetical protein
MISLRTAVVALAILAVGCGPQAYLPTSGGAVMHWSDNTIVSDHPNYVLACANGKIVGQIQSFDNTEWFASTKDHGNISDPFYFGLNEQFDTEDSAVAAVTADALNRGLCQ